MKRTAKSPGNRKKRARKPKNDEEDEPDPTVNYHLQQEDDDDVQAGYQEEGGTIIEGIYIPPVRIREAHPHTGERLVIEKIVCENFKSYGGVKEMGPFHKSFSAIVGPNGNGKSNIIDAMLFVFGYRAAKIRCKKVSVLIHKSEILPSVESCAVTVHFVKIIDNGEENNDDFQVVPNSQIKVLRRAYKDNSSSYWLANKRVKFQDVASFLNKNGIDIVHNRFLILQGEVESIAQMQPKSTNGHDAGLLEFLEEVIGSHRYIKCISELNTMCDTLSYQREEKLQRVDLVEREKRAMAEPVKKAKEFLRDKNSQSKIQHSLYQIQAYEGRKKFNERLQAKEEIEVKKKEVEARLEEIAAINKQRRDDFEKVEKEYRHAEKLYNKSKKSMDDVDSEYIKVNQDIKRSNEQRKKITKDLKDKETELEKQQNTPTNFEGEINKLEERKIVLDEEIGKEEHVIKNDIKHAEEKAAAKASEQQELQRNIGTLKRDRDAKKAAYDKAVKDLELYKHQEEEAKQLLERMELELQEVKAEIAEKQKQNRTSFGTQRFDQLTKDLKVKQDTARRLEQLEVECSDKCTKWQSKYQESRESLQGGSVHDKVYKLLLEAKNSGKIPGFRGKLKDLATIEEKYNIGASVATGILDYWVADNEDTTQECIETLRRNGIAAQTFLVVHRMRHYLGQSQRPFQTPPNSNRIFDLLKMSSPDLAPVFYKAYRDTLITEDVKTATEVAFDGARRHRVVTFAGAIIQTTGSMVGGGGRPAAKLNSGMSKVLASKVTEEDVAQLRAKFDSASAELAKLNQEKRELLAEINSIENELKEFNIKGGRGKNELQKAMDLLPLKESKVQHQREVVQVAVVSPKVLKEKEKAINQLKNVLDSISKPYDDLDTQIKKLDTEISDIREKKIASIRAKLDKSVEQRKKVIAEINRLNVDLKNVTKNKRKLEQQIETQSKKVKDLENAMKKMAEDRNKLEEKGRSLKDEVQEATELLNKIQEEYNKQKETVSELSGEEKKLSKKKVNLDNDIVNLLKEMKGIDHQVKGFLANLEHITLNEIPEEEVRPLQIIPDEELDKISVKDFKDKLAKINHRLQKEAPNLNILDDFKKKVDQFLERVQELDEITIRRDKVREHLVLTTAYRLREFMEAFVQISSKLTEMFRMISMGGDAELSLVDNTSPFNSGIEFSVRPARKTWKKISNLSGGEKTLSSLALVFALHYYKPSPFYVMDEIDAALDFKNVSIIANYIKDRTKFTQFIIISLRSNMFELADSLLGVYKVDNMSYSIHIGVRRLLNQLKNKNEGSKPVSASNARPESADCENNKDETQKSNKGLLDNNLSAIIDGESEICVGGAEKSESGEDNFQDSQAIVNDLMSANAPSLNKHISLPAPIPEAEGELSDEKMDVDENIEASISQLEETV